MQIAEGSIVCGKSGKPLRVISASEGKVVVKTDGRLIRVDQSLILRVISPPPTKPAPLAIGDTCYYCGSQYWQQYRGMELKAFMLREGYWTCEKPDGYRTTNISPSELSRSPVDKPTKKAAKQVQKGQWVKDWEKNNQRQVSATKATGIEIGDQLRRNTQEQTKYPSSWFPGEADDRDHFVYHVPFATVERISSEGYWARTTDDRLFHVPESAIEDGTWELIEP
jgi:hypothetical protein